MLILFLKSSVRLDIGIELRFANYKADALTITTTRWLL